MNKVYVVGLGPGGEEFMTAQARAAMERADVLCGYTVYVDLVKHLYPGKETYVTPMTRELERCRWALETAAAGRTVAMVCSGDAGVYGMAGPLLQLAGEYGGAEVEVVPGVTSALSGAAVLGAPLFFRSDKLTGAGVAGCVVGFLGVLLAAGRSPNTKDLFGPGFSVEQDEKGAILVDEHFRTNRENVYAIGDVIPGVQLAHVASAQGIVAVENMLGEEPSIRLDVIPDCIYTNPEIASVGLTEAQAKAQGMKVKTSKASMLANGKSMISLQDRGFIKLVYDEEGDRLVGAQLMCARATDMVGELATAIVNGLSQKQLAAVIRPHPTYVEAVTEAVEDLEGMAIHMAKKRKI